jgi:hypothetical protein
MSTGSKLNLSEINDEDFRQILIRLTNPHHRTCKRKRREGRVKKILANLPTNVSGLDVGFNEGIGDAGMMHLHLIPDSVTDLNLSQCGLPLSESRGFVSF